ncbi:MAG: anti-sigma factor [Chloroflexota bacterium]|nr:anti-sigma factor [Chloroflexota bacterium]
MKCEYVNELLTAYLDDELTPDERDQIKAHLSVCQHCREELKVLTAVRSKSRQAVRTMAARATAPTESWESIKQQLVGEQTKVTIFSLAKSKIKGGLDMLRRLFLWRPVWKPALVSALALALIIGFALFVPSPFGPSPEVLAADIAQNSPEVRAALGGDEVETLKVVNIKHDIATVIVEGKMGGIVTAFINLHTKAVTKAVGGPQLTDEEKENALSIVKADPRVRELLDKGAIIDMILPMYVHASGINQETGEIEEISETWAQVWINLGDKQWGAQVDLIRGKVVTLTE